MPKAILDSAIATTKADQRRESRPEEEATAVRLCAPGPLARTSRFSQPGRGWGSAGLCRVASTRAVSTVDV